MDSDSDSFGRREYYLENNSSDSYSDEESSASSDDSELRTFDDMVRRVHQNNPFTTTLSGSGLYGDFDEIQNMTEKNRSGLGRILPATPTWKL